MKKIVAILLSISLILNISVTCMSMEEKNYSPNISSETYEIELSLNELEKGIDVYAIQNADGCIEIVKSNETQVNNRSASTVATFHVGLTRVQTNKGILTWNAVMPQLKKSLVQFIVNQQVVYSQQHTVQHPLYVHTLTEQKDAQAEEHRHFTYHHQFHPLELDIQTYI